MLHSKITNIKRMYVFKDTLDFAVKYLFEFYKYSVRLSRFQFFFG